MRTLAAATTMAAAVLCSACGSDSVPSGNKNPAQLFWKLQLNTNAVTLSLVAPGNSVHLVATPRTPTGAALTTSAPVHFSIVNNDTSVTLDSSGVMTAHAPAQWIHVVAKQTIDGVTLSDTAFVNINDVPQPTPQVASYVLASPPGDSAKRDCDILQSLVIPYTAMVTALDGNNTSIDNIAIAYRSSHPEIAYIDSTGTVQAVAVGTAMLYAESNVYGVEKVDSMLFTVTDPLATGVYVESVTPDGTTTPIGVFSQGVQTIGVGGTVIWTNQSKLPIDVVFDNPNAVKAVPSDNLFYFLYAGFYQLGTEANPNQDGNIASFGSVTDQGGGDGVGVRIRWFPTAGTYTYHSALYGTKGTITVR